MEFFPYSKFDNIQKNTFKIFYYLEQCISVFIINFKHQVLKYYNLVNMYVYCGVYVNNVF